jgi:hypothetical protein
MPVRINIPYKRVFTKDIALGNVRNVGLFSKNNLCNLLIVNKLPSPVVYNLREVMGISTVYHC